MKDISVDAGGFMDSKKDLTVNSQSALSVTSF